MPLKINHKKSVIATILNGKTAQVLHLLGVCCYFKVSGYVTYNSINQ